MDRTQPGRRRLLGPAFVQLAAAPVYSATEAAVRAFPIALRGTSVRVIELIPPVVESRLHRRQTRKPP